MVSRPTLSTIPRFITSEATSRIVHLALPSGGGPQTSATMAASSTLSSMGSPPGRGLSSSAACNPSLLYRSATRFTSRWYPPTALAAASTDSPLSSCSSVRIRRQVRAESFCRFRRFSSLRSAADNFSRGGRAAVLTFTPTLRSRKPIRPQEPPDHNRAVGALV